MESIIAHQKAWIKEQNKHCSYDYLDNYQDNLFMTLDGEDLDNFKMEVVTNWKIKTEKKQR